MQKKLHVVNILLLFTYLHAITALFLIHIYGHPVIF